MICLCCGKEITKAAKPEETEHQWHSHCIKKFFGIRQMPELSVDHTQLEQLAVHTVSKGLTVPGVQKKLSLHLSSWQGTDRLTIVDYPTGYILKPQSEEFKQLPEYEFLAMQMAEKAGIRTVPYALIKTSDGTAYITRRVDREISGSEVRLFAMEDFCQLGRRLTQDKYRGSYEQCAKTVERYSSTPGLDLSELFIRIVFSYIVGNSDMHLKNFSMIETEPGSRIYHLSEAYDILPVNIVMPEDKEETALTLNGKKRNIRKKDFLIFAEKCGLPEKTAKKIIEKLCSLEEKYLSVIKITELLGEEESGEFTEFVRNRIANLKT